LDCCQCLCLQLRLLGSVELWRMVPWSAASAAILGAHMRACALAWAAMNVPLSACRAAKAAVRAVG